MRSALFGLGGLFLIGTERSRSDGASGPFADSQSAIVSCSWFAQTRLASLFGTRPSRGARNWRMFAV